MSLRLMISHFKKIGYEPIVGDSFTSDTPLFIKYDNDLIDIKPISWLINEEKIETDSLGREYDHSKKNYKVLCRSGWVRPNYIYRHKTDKDIYNVNNESTEIDVTEDHSLFNDKMEKIKPSEISDDTKLEYYDKVISNSVTVKCNDELIKRIAKLVNKDSIKKIPIMLLNISDDNTRKFMNLIDKNVKHKSKTVQAGLMYMENKLNGGFKLLSPKNKPSVQFLKYCL